MLVAPLNPYRSQVLTLGPSSVSHAEVAEVVAAAASNIGQFTWLVVT